jgi:AcrR family transcriptional regulator
MARVLDENKKRRILDSAFHFFGEKGFEGTSVKSIADSAGVAPGSIYTYFRDKEELFCSTVDDGWNRFAEAMQETLEGNGDPKNGFLRFTDFGFGLLKKVYPLLRGMYSDANRRQLFQKTIEKIVEYVDRLLSNSSTSKSLNLPEKPEERKFFIKIIISGILFTTSTAPPSRLNSVIDELKRGFKNGLLPPVASISPG